MKVGIDYVKIYASHCIISDKWYIGQTTRDFEERKDEHIYDSFNLTKTNHRSYNCVFHRAIRKYGIENFEWFVIEDNIPVPYHFEGRKKISDYTAADGREIYWIADKNSYEHGYNMTKGGHDTFVICCIPVCQYTRDGKKVGEYESIKEASRLTGINKVNISACASGKCLTAGNYYWKYASDENPDEIESCKNNAQGERKAVLQYSLDGNFIAEYSNALEAGRKNDFDGRLITSAGRDKNYDIFYCKHYQWMFKTTDDYPLIIQPYKRPLTNHKCIIQCSLDGNVLGEYESVASAARLLNLNGGGIKNAINISKSHHSQGSLWYAKNEYYS